MRKFINDGNAELLERVKLICTKIHGKPKTSFDTAMAYLENNNLEKAMSIIEVIFSYKYLFIWFYSRKYFQ